MKFHSALWLFDNTNAKKSIVFDRFYEFLRHVQTVEVKAVSAVGVYEATDKICTKIYVIQFSACYSGC